jgi:hypothetical protein
MLSRTGTGDPDLQPRFRTFYVKKETTITNYDQLDNDQYQDNPQNAFEVNDNQLSYHPYDN